MFYEYEYDLENLEQSIGESMFKQSLVFEETEALTIVIYYFSFSIQKSNINIIFNF